MTSPLELVVGAEAAVCANGVCELAPRDDELDPADQAIPHSDPS